MFAIGGAAIALVLTVLRLFAGPTLYDRALAAKAIAIMVAVTCAALASVLGQAAWVDVALAMVFAVFVLSAAVLKFFRAGTFQAPLMRAAPPQERA